MTSYSSSEYNVKVKFVTISGMLLNLVLSIIKVIAGYIGHSQSVIADGIHSLSDCTTDIAILIGLKYWNEPPDECHPYGHRRYEALVTVFIGLALFVAGFGLAYQAISRFKTGIYIVPSSIALYAALVSIFVKEILYRWTSSVAKELNSPSMNANAWHHRTDALSSVAVAIAILIIRSYPGWGFLDPIATIVVSIFILQAAYVILLPSLKELIDKGAEPQKIQKIKNIIMKIDGVISMHALRTRFHGPGLQLDLHLQVDGKITVTEGHIISGRAKKALIESDENIIDVLIHIEPWEGK